MEQWLLILLIVIGSIIAAGCLLWICLTVTNLCCGICCGICSCMLDVCNESAPSVISGHNKWEMWCTIWFFIVKDKIDHHGSVVIHYFDYYWHPMFIIDSLPPDYKKYVHVFIILLVVAFRASMMFALLNKWIFFIPIQIK